jgi:uracil-DNA glycosylase
MLTERQLRAWNGLDMGPAWVSRSGKAVGAARPDRQPAEEAAGGWPDEASAFEAYAVAPSDDLAIDAALASVAQAAGASPPEFGPGQGSLGSPAGDSWERVREEVSGCRRCRLCESRRQTVFGSGSERARWMLIGEAPGAEEDARGEPFVGQAGRLLDQMLAAIGLSRPDDVFITNILKCRPPGNRNPEPIEAETCSNYLYRQIELLQPDLILLLGRFAAQGVLKTDASVAALRRQVHTYRSAGGEIPVVCTYHPAYLLRNLADKRKCWEDLCLATDVAARQQGLRQDAGA